ncbi:MAG TPA: hydroxyacid dehydrogenase, partial [Planctomycetes bacterium]|nr:hydroxyacid dehydrogenase [Planctomycetota bacterium]
GIVNTCRGGIIDEEAVAEALESGKIGGYATDVWLSDPPDPSSPILKAPNTVLLPHIGASTAENLLRIGEIVERILEEFSGK